MKFDLEIHDVAAYEIATACAHTLETLENAQVRVHLKQSRNNAERDNSQLDGIFTIKGPWGSEKLAFEAKRRVTADSIDALIQRLKTAAKEKRLFLAAAYINDNLGARLRQENIAYADAAGNAYISLPHFYIWLRGFGPIHGSDRVTRSFQATGLQLIALLLINPEAVNWDYRRLSEEAGLSLGSVSQIFGDLRKGGFTQLAGKRERRLLDRASLFSRWELGYLERLRPKLRPKIYRLADAAPLQSLLERVHAVGVETILIGGELAMAEHMKNLRPERATLHVKHHVPMLHVPSYLQLIPAADGNVEIIDHFGHGDTWLWPHGSGIKFAHPVLVHAEMMRYSSDGRIREATQMLFDNHIAPILDHGYRNQHSRIDAAPRP